MDFLPPFHRLSPFFGSILSRFLFLLFNAELVRCTFRVFTDTVQRVFLRSLLSIFPPSSCCGRPDSGCHGDRQPGGTWTVVRILGQPDQKEKKVSNTICTEAPPPRMTAKTTTALLCCTCVDVFLLPGCSCLPEKYVSIRSRWNGMRARRGNGRRCWLEEGWRREEGDGGVWRIHC